MTVGGMLTRLIMPVAFLAALVGFVTIGAVAVASLRSSPSEQPSGETAAPASTSLDERGAVALCALLSLLGVVVVVQIIRLRHSGTPPYSPAAIVFAIAMLAMGLPALLWRTRARTAGEGVATIAVGVAAVVSGFSIGFVFVPLALLMMWVCFRHLLHIDRARRIRA